MVRPQMLWVRCVVAVIFAVTIGCTSATSGGGSKSVDDAEADSMEMNDMAAEDSDTGSAEEVASEVSGEDIGADISSEEASVPAGCNSAAPCPSGLTCDVGACGADVVGTCVTTPVDCSQIYEPVCGCDGMTYANDCKRLVAGVAQDDAGACAEPGSCTDSTDCGGGETCDLNGCGVDAVGLCVPNPAFCPAAVVPVCGCDGQTYSNNCDRIQAGVALDHPGACDAPSLTCGPSVEGSCAADSVCNLLSCSPTTVGTCVVKPKNCDAVLDPVCACDGTTYTNDCERLQAGAPLDHPGKCEIENPVACGPDQSVVCALGETCDLLGCGPEAIGWCKETPDLCTEELNPVCGCDDKTYTNDCKRLQAGVSLAYPGKCLAGPPMGGPVCGGPAGSKCAPEEVCDQKGCGPSAPGMCVPPPLDCSGAVVEPICGCDGVTYDNHCLRLQAGAAFQSAGPCKPILGLCGGSAGTSCSDPLLYCDPQGCGENALGKCIDLSNCLGLLDTPVCGCDGETYANHCERIEAGVAFDHIGSCMAPLPAGCGGVGGVICPMGATCDVLGCGDDVLGQCVEAPKLCTEDIEPVCGCDGETYDNDCKRLVAGVPKQGEGECIADAP